MEHKKQILKLTDVEETRPSTLISFKNGKNGARKSFIKKLKANVIELILVMSIQGVPNVFRTKHYFMKFVWIICLVISVIYTAYNILMSVLDYLQYDVITSVRVVNELPTEFPKITICNKNTYASKFAYDLLSNYSADNFRKPFELLTESELKFFKEFLPFGFDVKPKLGYKIEEMLIKCSFSNKKCDTNDFQRIYHSFYGNCFVFNSQTNQSKVKKSFIAGVKGGLSLELYVGVPKNLEVLASFTGALIGISNNSFARSTFQTLDVSPGKETNIIVKKTFLNQYPKPYSNCDFDSFTSSFDSVLYRSLVRNNVAYNQQDCYIQCYQKKVEEKCMCSFPSFFPVSLNNKLCIDNASQLCAIELRDPFFTGEIQGYEECSRLCPLECKQMQFSFSMSSSGYMTPKNAEFNYFNNSIVKSKYKGSLVTYDDVKSSVVVLNIFYDDLSHTEVTESVKITVNQMFSNIGGALGLCIGMSVMSLIEILEILVEIGMIWFAYLNNKVEKK